MTPRRTFSGRLHAATAAAGVAGSAACAQVLSQNFDAGLSGSGWAVVSAVPGSPVRWVDRAVVGRENYASVNPGDQSNCAAADSYFYGLGSQPNGYDTRLESPLFSLAGRTRAVLRYDLNFHWADGADTLDVDLSADAGQSWTNLRRYNRDVGGAFTANAGVRVEIDLAAYLGRPNLKVRFRYFNLSRLTWDWYAQVDNVEVDDRAPPVEIYAQNFNAGLAASGWAVENAVPSSPVAWANMQVTGAANYASATPGDQSNAPIADSDYYGQGSQPDGFDTRLVSPVIDLTRATEATLAYDANFQRLGPNGAPGEDTLDVDLSPDAGQSWRTLRRHDADTGGLYLRNTGDRFSLDLAPFLGRRIRLRFRYFDPGPDAWEWYAQADNVRIVGRLADPCYPDCDVSTGLNTLDIFDFLCFQNLFDQGDPYACGCDLTTGPGVCDIFDFLCFQNAYAQGCP